MLIPDLSAVGTALFALRRKAGKTQEQVAEAAELSARAYADIERGTANPRFLTIVRICNALSVTPDALLAERTNWPDPAENLFDRLKRCSAQERQTALRLVNVYLDSLKK